MSGKRHWFYASYPGECSTCFSPFDEGEEIRADGAGGWEAKACRANHDDADDDSYEDD